MQIETKFADVCKVSLPAERRKLRVNLHYCSTFATRDGMTKECKN
jgi:hypothetical protein